MHYFAQMSGYIKYFDSSEKICLLWLKKINYWLNIKIFGTKLRKFETWNFIVSLFMMKTKVKAFNDVFITVFWNDRAPKESAHYVRVAVKITDSVLKMEENNCPQVYSK